MSSDKSRNGKDTGSQDSEHRVISLELDPEIEHFKENLIPHPVFEHCEREIIRHVAYPGTSNILSVVGVTGAGKTQLLHEVVGDLLGPCGRGPNDPYLPVVAVKANAGRTFESRYKAVLLAALGIVHPVAAELGVIREEPSRSQAPADNGTKRVRAPARLQDVDRVPIARLLNLLYQALPLRKVRALLIDEGQDLAHSANTADWHLLANNLKQLAHDTRTLIVLFGTDELISLPRLSGQLARRSKAVHFRRYLWENEEDRAVFEWVLVQFSSLWPSMIPKDLLLKNIRFIYTGCIGSVGSCSGWLCEAIKLAKDRKRKALTLEILRETAMSELKLRKIYSEALRCESEFAKDDAGFESFIDEVCPLAKAERSNSDEPLATDAVSGFSKKTRRRPGDRLPSYDKYDPKKIEPLYRAAEAT